MNNEEKILELLGKIQAKQDRMQAKLEQVQEQLYQIQVQQGQTELQLNRIDSRLDRRLDRVDSRLDQARDNMKRIRLYLELDAGKQLDSILDQLVSLKRMEKVEDDFIALKTTVNTLARDVAGLKKAQ